ncbi:MAG: hypothetical protein ABEH59_02475, partial [Halobacteriales archaeon]
MQPDELTHDPNKDQERQREKYLTIVSAVDSPIEFVHARIEVLIRRPTIDGFCDGQATFGNVDEEVPATEEDETPSDPF